jgi:hypothetical protein
MVPLTGSLAAIAVRTGPFMSRGLAYRRRATGWRSDFGVISVMIPTQL